MTGLGGIGVYLLLSKEEKIIQGTSQSYKQNVELARGICRRNVYKVPRKISRETDLISKDDRSNNNLKSTGF